MRDPASSGIRLQHNTIVWDGEHDHGIMGDLASRQSRTSASASDGTLKTENDLAPVRLAAQ
jgi:hypothetical protein